MDEALNQKSIEILEVDKEGSVPDLKVVNKTSTMILILDGEELVGAKQNRIVNTTILIPANSTITIPVSCVEQGRWSYDSPTFLSVFKKLVGSFALDAIDWFKEDKEFKVLKSKVTQFLNNTSKANITTHKSVGEGIDCRLETKKIAGFSLCHEDQIPHMSIFAKSDIDKSSSRMQRFSQRRHYTI